MLDFARQFHALRKEILSAIETVCDSQSFILGPVVSDFEHAAARACDVPFAVGCSSGTEALWLALAACGVGDSADALRAVQPQSVITSPFTFFATASSILRAGAKPVFCDIDPRTFNLNPAALAERLRSSGERGSTPAAAPIKALLAVHLYGQCVDMDAFTRLRNELPGLVLIEDAAQAFGAEWNGSPAGFLGDAAAFSFYPTKNLSAFGDAGLVTTPREDVAVRLRSLRAHGMTRRYHHDEVGWNSRMDAIQAAVLSVKLKYLPEWNQRRRDLAVRYDELFRDAAIAAPAGSTSPADGVVLPWTDPRATHVFHQYVIRAERRDALREHLSALGIGSEVYYPVPLHLQAALRDLGYKPGDFPETERAAAEVLALPIFPELRDDEQQSVVEAIREFYR